MFFHFITLVINFYELEKKKRKKHCPLVGYSREMILYVLLLRERYIYIKQVVNSICRKFK